MGVVFISSSAARSPLGLSTDLLTHRSSLKKPSIVAFKADDSALIIPPREQVLIPAEKHHEKKRVVVTKRKPSKIPKKPSSLDHNLAPSCSLGVDYYEAAARLESIYKLSPATVEEDVVVDDSKAKVPRRRRRKESGEEKKKVVVRNNVKKDKRLSLDKRIALKRNSQEKPVVASAEKKETKRQQEEEKIDRLMRDYSASNDIVSLDWKKMKIPPVLSSTEHAWLFKLMQPMKVFCIFFSIACSL